jgi:hypothetical protein
MRGVDIFQGLAPAGSRITEDNSAVGASGSGKSPGWERMKIWQDGGIGSPKGSRPDETTKENGAMENRPQSRAAICFIYCSIVLMLDCSKIFALQKF